VRKWGSNSNGISKGLAREGKAIVRIDGGYRLPHTPGTDINWSTVSSIAALGLPSAGLSQTKGPAVPLLDRTTTEVFQETVRRFPGREALVVRQEGARPTAGRGSRADRARTSGPEPAAGRPGRSFGPATGWSGHCCIWLVRGPASCRGVYGGISPTRARLQHQSEPVCPAPVLHPQVFQ